MALHGHPPWSLPYPGLPDPVEPGTPARGRGLYEPRRAPAAHTSPVGIEKNFRIAP